MQYVVPNVEPDKPNPAVQYCQEIFPVLSAIVDNFLDFSPICERVCRCWRTMIFSYRAATKPLLPALANKISSCFATSRQGCFLWTTDAIVREYSESAEFVEEETLTAIYHFFEELAVSMLRALNNVPPGELPDGTSFLFLMRRRKLTSSSSHRRLLPAPHGRAPVLST